MSLKRVPVLFLLATLSCLAQQSSPAAKPPAKTTAPAANGDTRAPTFDLQALVRDTEQVDMQRHKMGVFWWVPFEFWVAVGQQQGISSEQVTEIFQPFKNYNVFILAVGDLGVGQASWADDSELKKNIVLRDQRGNAYKPMKDPPEDIKPLVQLMRPIFKNMLGNFGEGMQFVVFPLKDEAGNVFADPRARSEMSLDVIGMMGVPTSSYTWKFPLTSLVPPKFCPVGKERVEANWRYCPWHGNKLEDPATASAMPAQTKH